MYAVLDSSPSPAERQGVGYDQMVHSTTPFAGRYNHHGGVQPLGLDGPSSRPFGHDLQGGGFQRDFSRPGQTHNHPDYTTRFGRPWIREPPHSVSPAQYASPRPSPASRDRQVPGYNVISTQDDTHHSLGLRLRPVSELPDKFRGVFKFGVFNAIQSTCFDQVLHSQENLVISAPTGSGKTVLFELAIIRMLTSNDSQSAKCVYVAPTKALCTEKHKEWTAKFGGLGVKSCELTGDTLILGKGIWGDAKSSQIIVTTAEKWDSVTRNWADHFRILSHIKLFLVDEVHILNESRGSILEVVISRMRSRESAIRFLLVSATVPNIEDVACWVGSSDRNDQPAKIFQFGEEFRPCKLTKFVYGVAKPKGQNDFAYAHILDLRLFPVLQQHSADKPILIFCPTRKGTVATAKQLAKDYEAASKAKQALPWLPPTRIDRSFHDKELPALATMGVAVHHAGLDTDDRKAVEELYLQKTLRVLVATSTLAVGVNLPAHMVVIKGVKLYQNGEMREYSDLDVMQMMGRAGRPQFDHEGIAIILCETDLEQKYRALTQGTTTLESSLHRNLAEHLNSEIGLGTISSVESAKDWLHRSFLFHRIQKNPRHYDVGKDEKQTWQEKMDEIVMQSILSLRETQLIAYTEGDGELCSTEYGDVMSKFYIRQSTMRAILDLPSSTSMREVLEMVSSCEELGELKLRSGEKQMYEKIRRHNDIRFPPKKVTGTSDKILLLLQAILAGLPLYSPEFKSAEGQPYLEAVSIFRHATRIATAVAEVAIINRSGAQLKHALELQVPYQTGTRFQALTVNYRIRCLNAKAWEDRPLVLRQIEHIGEKSVKVLAENGIYSIQKLLQTSPLRIEELLNRRTPFGFDVLAAANAFPRYFVNLKEIGSTHSNGNSPVEVQFSVECGLVFDGSVPQRVKKPKWGKTEMTTLLIVTSDLVFIDFRRTATKTLKDKKEFTVTAQLTKPSQAINVYIASDKFAGVTVTQTLKPHITPDKYPTLDTRPLTSVEMDLKGLEDVPDFWDMNLDDEIQDLRVIDLTKRCGGNTKPPQAAATAQPNPRSSSPVRESREEREPRKRPDREIRVGLLEPPRAPKKKQQINVEDSDAKVVASQQRALNASSLIGDDPKRQTQSSQLVPVSRFKPPKGNSILQQLDSLHKNADIAHNLRLTKGQRLKLTDDSKNAKPSKVVPNFDLQLTTLRRSRSPPLKTAPMADNCDVLPLISEMLEQDETTSETNYSNSEIDAMIRDVPLDNPTPVQAPSTPKRRKRTWGQSDASPSNTEHSPPRHRGISSRPYSMTAATKDAGVTSKMKREMSPSKRARMDSATDLVGPLSHLLSKQATPHSVSLESSGRRLLSPSFDDDDSDAVDLRERAQEQAKRSATRDQTPAYDDDFYLDETWFNAIPDSSSATVINHSSAKDGSATQLSSNELSRDGATTHGTSFSRSDGLVKEDTPQIRDDVKPGMCRSVLKRKASYALSPSRFSGFIRRSKPQTQLSKIDEPTLYRSGSALPHIETRTIPFASTHVGVSAQIPAHSIDPASTNDLDGTWDDPLAEFDRWLASGAVEITSD
ncbi:P-loop containing nucleoside triphosphate hydrolase protein [Melanogaster broomeanus]|nr:P-loop containing nucleoside triphosphate hydrolase protein [Melanogaster broomeanus]